MYSRFNPPGTGLVLQLQGREIRQPRIQGHRITHDVHSTGHIIARRRKDVRSVRTPLNLSDGVFVTWKLHLARAADGLARRRDGARHATVPDLDYLVHPGARDHERTVLVPVDGKELRTRGWDGEDGGRDRVGKRVGCGTGRIGWRS